MGKALDAPQGLGIAKGLFKHDPRAQLLDKARLARDAELFGKVAFDMRDGADRDLVHK